jgi:hypothetical protein
MPIPSEVIGPGVFLLAPDASADMDKRMRILTNGDPK